MFPHLKVRHRAEVPRHTGTDINQEDFHLGEKARWAYSTIREEIIMF